MAVLVAVAGITLLCAVLLAVWALRIFSSTLRSLSKRLSTREPSADDSPPVIVVDEQRSLEQSTGILVHGCHLQADGWERIVWGEAPLQMGRLPHAVLLAWQEQASVVVFGTGASEKDGLKESEYTLRYLWSHWSELSSFDAFADVPLDEVKRLLQRVAMLDVSTQNTDMEATEALRVFSERNCQRAILVSSPTHLPRCMTCASKALEKDPLLFTGTVMASASATCYENASASDVVVVEPPHRGDRDRSLDSLPFHKMVGRSFRVKAGEKRAFLQDLEALLAKYDA